MAWSHPSGWTGILVTCHASFLTMRLFRVNFLPMVLLYAVMTIHLMSSIRIRQWCSTMRLSSTSQATGTFQPSQCPPSRRQRRRSLAPLAVLSWQTVHPSGLRLARTLAQGYAISTDRIERECCKASLRVWNHPDNTAVVAAGHAAFRERYVAACFLGDTIIGSRAVGHMGVKQAPNKPNGKADFYHLAVAKGG